VCLIPASAHGTNPASAVMAGFKSWAWLRRRRQRRRCGSGAKATEHKDHLAALMLTYPSTHGVFEESVEAVVRHRARAWRPVYMDGANMNGQVGLCRPADIGADVCHINLHKNLCHPHGGGGPAWVPSQWPPLVEFLPGHPVVPVGGRDAIGAVSGAPGAAPTFCLSGGPMPADGRRKGSSAPPSSPSSRQLIAERLQPHYPVVYRGKNGRVAHECIVDLLRHSRRVRASRPRTWPSGSWTTASTPHHVLPHRGNLDDRADRERNRGRNGPLL